MSDNYGFAETLAQMETELGQTMTLQDDSTAYPCVVGARTDTHDLGMGGYAGGSTMEIVCRRALFTTETLPVLGDILYVNFKALKVLSVVLSPDEAVVVLQCDDVNKDS